VTGVRWQKLAEMLAEQFEVQADKASKAHRGTSNNGYQLSTRENFWGGVTFGWSGASPPRAQTPLGR
jgi:hypothetical protein